MRTDLLPHYSRLVATLNKYMPAIGADLVAAVSFHGVYAYYAHNLQLDEEFKYLQRKKNVVVELAEVRLKAS